MGVNYVIPDPSDGVMCRPLPQGGPVGSAAIPSARRGDVRPGLRRFPAGNVRPSGRTDQKLRLTKLDPAYKGRHETEDAAKQETQHYCEKLSRQQARPYPERKRSVLVVLRTA